MARGGLFATANVPAASTDQVLVATPVTGQASSIVVLAVLLSCGATATTVTFNSKSAGAGTAAGPVISLGANQTVVLPHDDRGWFASNAREGLSVTTGAGSAVGVQVSYRVA